MPIQFIYKQWQQNKGIAYTWWQAMNTRVDIILSGALEAELKAAANSIEAELKTLEKTGSYFDKAGELYLLNNCKSNSPVLVTDELYSIIECCMDYYQKTNGYFDIGIQSDKSGIPAMENVKLNREDRTVTFERDGIRLDLSGYLKGLALERIRKILSEYRINDALINMGNSSVLALGNHPHGQGWKIKYNHNVGKDDVEIVLKDECFTTSGNDSAGRRHIINPRTGDFIEDKKQVSVITPSGTDGEVLSTALFAGWDVKLNEILLDFPNTRILS